MPMYPALKRMPWGKRAAERLIDLRNQLRRDIPRKSTRNTLLLATWNIRDFDSNKFGHGPRLDESYYYIAEIISNFDLVAIQEVNENLKAIENVVRILGPSWTYIATDITEGRPGNGERMCFIYDRNTVEFRNIAGEIVLPTSLQISDNKQFARTPFLVSFQSGWFKFNLCTVHLYFGSESGAALQQRIEEIETIAKFLAKRAKSSNENFILLGDFNIVSPEHKTMQALQKAGFFIPPQLLSKPTNMFKTKHYDQIAFYSTQKDLIMPKVDVKGGSFDYYESVYRPADHDTYVNSTPKVWPTEKAKSEKYFLNDWRTFQMSDHLPMWIELNIDFSEKYLQSVIDAQP